MRAGQVPLGTLREVLMRAAEAVHVVRPEGRGRESTMGVTPVRLRPRSGPQQGSQSIRLQPPRRGGD